MKSTDDATSRDRGSMSVLAALTAVSIVASLSFGLMPVLVDLAHRQRARSAADAAALAGVTGGRTAAAALATANGAELIAYGRAGRAVTVRVQVGDQVVVARATDAP